MPFKLTQVEPLLTKAELSLVTQSFPPQLKTLDVTRLRSKLDRARKLSDKYRDMRDRQARAGRGKGHTASRGTASLRSEATAKRAQVFDEAIARLQAELRRRLAQEKAAKAKEAALAKKQRISERLAKVHARKATKKTKKTKKTRKKLAATSAVNERPMAISRAERQMQRTGDLRTRAHVASRGRRQQARRDAR
jgi:hypothetical protein